MFFYFVEGEAGGEVIEGRDCSGETLWVREMRLLLRNENYNGIDCIVEKMLV